MTKHPIIFDACALINLLIIDDGDLLLNAVNRISTIEGKKKYVFLKLLCVRFE